MNIFQLDVVSKFLLFAVLCFFSGDLLKFALGEKKRIDRLMKTGTETTGEFTNIRSEIVKRKMKCTADLAYKDQNGETIRWLWQKGLFDEEVLLFRNTGVPSVKVKVIYDPENPKDMVVKDCYNPRKHKLVIGLCIAAVIAFGITLLLI